MRLDSWRKLSKGGVPNVPTTLTGTPNGTDLLNSQTEALTIYTQYRLSGGV
jgi:hypothetical protein